MLAILLFALIIPGWASYVDSVKNLPANTWYSVPATTMRPAMAGTGITPKNNIISAWSGGAYDDVGHRQLIFGGGLGNYIGNEVYAFSTDSMKWARLTEPCLVSQCCDPNPCGTPMVRHTYNYPAFISHANRFFIHDGAWNCGYQGCANGLPNSMLGTGCGMSQTWTLNMVTYQWELNQNDSSAIGGDLINGCEGYSVYDPVSGKVYYGNSRNMGVYDYNTDTWVNLNGDRCTGQTAIVDTKRHLLVRIGDQSSNWDKDVTVYPLNQATITKQKWTTSGDTAALNLKDPGLAYDPVIDQYVLWRGGSVYTLNPETRVWTANIAANVPAVTSTGGMFGRFRYVAHLNAYLAVLHIDSNVYFYKLTAGDGSTSASRSIKASESRIQIMLSPNPVSKILDVALAGLSADLMAKIHSAAVYNIQGRKMLNIADNFTNGKMKTLVNVSSLNTGVYVLNVKIGNRNLKKEFMVVR